MSTFICDVSRTNDYGQGCEYAVVTISPKLARKILARRTLLLEMKAKDPETYEAYFWSCSCDFYDMSPDSEPGKPAPKVLDLTELGIPEKQGEWVETDADFTPFIAARTECDQMVVRDSGVCWYAIPKHASWTVLTQELQYEAVEAVLAAESAAEVRV